MALNCVKTTWPPKTLKPFQLDSQTIKQSGSKASRMNGYSLEDVGKMVLGMDSVIGIELKKQVFGSVSTLAKFDTKGGIGECNGYDNHSSYDLIN